MDICRLIVICGICEFVDYSGGFGHRYCPFLGLNQHLRNVFVSDMSCIKGCLFGATGPS